jgi:hypothetical protein
MVQQQSPPSYDDEMIGSPEVRRLLGGVSETWLTRRLDPDSLYFDQAFPRPLQYRRGGPRYWPRGEIIAYREGKRRGPDAAVQPRTEAVGGERGAAPGVPQQSAHKRGHKNQAPAVTVAR